MIKKKSINPFNWKTALVLSITVSLIMNLIVLLTAAEVKRLIQDIPELSSVMYTGTLLRFGTNILSLFILYIFGFKIINSSWSRPKKLVSILVGTIVISFILSFLFSQLLVHLKMFSMPLPMSQYTFFVVLRDLIIAMVVLLSILLLYLADQRQKTYVENEKLKTENIRNRYEALKNQVDPHFLFNSLNTLNGLIGYDDVRAHEYVEKLSSVFRYTIQNKEIVKLSDELDFVESYSYLMKIRYGENLQLDVKVDEKYLSHYIMPISLELLVENAIKHNVISNKYPLLIKIKTTAEKTIVVENAVQAKSIPAVSTGIGLANLTERYKLLSKKEVIITNINNVFRVEIPLISPDKMEQVKVK